jgi:branched-chain amino acid transport system ATP-binding protein
MPLLDIHGLTVAYGGVHANDDVDLVVEAGQVCGLIGPNGAGKTTFIDAISGFTRPASGRVSFDGSDITSLSPAQRADAGLTRTFQSIELFDDLTVWENLLVAAERPRWWSGVVDLVRPSRRSAAEQQAEWALDVIGLGHLRDRLTTHLSHGQRKLVSVARALANRPKLVLLDEPAAGLDTAESQAVGSHLRDFLTRGISVLLVDHDMGLVLEACDHIYVLDFGRVIAQGTPAEIQSNPAVVAAYLGEPVTGLGAGGAS